MISIVADVMTWHKLTDQKPVGLTTVRHFLICVPCLLFNLRESNLALDLGSSKMLLGEHIFAN